jgi:hypothetical protein
MPHIHWVARQNKLEIPNDEEEVNTREIHKCDGQAHDPDTMVAPLTPKPTRPPGLQSFFKKIGKEKKQPGESLQINQPSVWEACKFFTFSL